MEMMHSSRSPPQLNSRIHSEALCTTEQEHSQAFGMYLAGCRILTGTVPRLRLITFHELPVLYRQERLLRKGMHDGWLSICINFPMHHRCAAPSTSRDLSTLGSAQLMRQNRLTCTWKVASLISGLKARYFGSLMKLSYAYESIVTASDFECLQQLHRPYVGRWPILEDETNISLHTAVWDTMPGFPISVMNI